MKGESRRPRSLKEALEFRAAAKALPFGGGTDLMVRFRGYSGTGAKIDGPVLFLDKVEELLGLREEGNTLVIGAAVTMTRLLAHPRLPLLLRRALSQVAAPALRNRATLGGNICNASPAADSLPPLYVHEARVHLASVTGERDLPIEEFCTGPGATVLAADELLTEIRIPMLPRGRHYYRKVGTRRANALSKISAAGFAQASGGVISDFRFALGAVAPTVVRLPETEALLCGTPVEDLETDALLSAADGHIRPIDDQRSTADYRRRVARNSLSEFIESLIHSTGAEEA